MSDDFRVFRWLDANDEPQTITYTKRDEIPSARGGNDMADDDFSGFTKQELEEMIDEVAVDLFRENPIEYGTLAVARDEIWKNEPGLYRSYVNAPHIQPVQEVQKRLPERPETETTVRDHLWSAVQKRAETLQLKPGNLSKTTEELEFEVLNYTDEGSRVYDMMASASGATEVGEARTEIRKSMNVITELGEVLDIASGWLR